MMNCERYHYEFRVAEPLAESQLVWFPDLAITQADPDGDCEGACTIISGWLPDQPALFSTLARIRDLNLTLVSVHRRTHGRDI
jgi:hypothetical protein